MWQPTELTTQTRSVKVGHPKGTLFTGTELLVDGTRLSNAIELVCWDCDPAQLVICEQCEVMGCHSGDWVSIRRVADHILILPAFADSLKVGYEFETPPRLIAQKGSLLLDRSQGADLRRLVPDLPELAEFKQLTAREAVQLLLFEAPPDVRGKAWSYGTYRIGYKREAFLATDHESDEEAIGVLDRLLEPGLDADAPVALRPLSGADKRVSFYFDHRGGFVEWQPLAVAGGQFQLLLEPGYVVESTKKPATAR